MKKDMPSDNNALSLLNEVPQISIMGIADKTNIAERSYSFLD